MDEELTYDELDETEYDTISLIKLRRCVMGIVPESELNPTELVAFEIYLKGYEDGQVSATLEAAERIDPVKAKEWTDKFLNVNNVQTEVVEDGN